jgi:aspartate aminotransferase-like enzyme
VGGALDPRHGQIVRIGHMGDLEPVHLARLFDTLDAILI